MNYDLDDDKEMILQELLDNLDQIRREFNLFMLDLDNDKDRVLRYRLVDLTNTLERFDEDMERLFLSKVLK